eukprot:Protomagalhaensia_wolfi_Nauph_80__4448@NODE_455_length_2498_cov_18_836519_g341_i0_p1_GENE_NODE_455_length_2498_cov_18_836519_g341_i0NODE_455_length_2498_cov_18_836519_g341_i0_p1_ORF_typecomplete_len477_score92_36Alginate_lyase/PF05426_12/0_0047Kinetochor_Ybp2/PF08568_10/0_014Tuberin/PF03542_16/0_11HCNGP/PF07818_13/0_37HCNGP/PF07818_13/4_8e03DUF4637/PF15470_6/1_7DUF4637/PF15470_6/3_3e02AKAP95/PF04988_12/47AKAP95/PF04988_12/3AKAP95/PF04988_12/2_3e03_NODE_455_length_2498_cov_18_836519_g341_i0102324
MGRWFLSQLKRQNRHGWRAALQAVCNGCIQVYLFQESDFPVEVMRCETESQHHHVLTVTPHTATAALSQQSGESRSAAFTLFDNLLCNAPESQSHTSVRILKEKCPASNVGVMDAASHFVYRELLRNKGSSSAWKPKSLPPERFCQRLAKAQEALNEAEATFLALREKEQSAESSSNEEEETELFRRDIEDARHRCYKAEIYLEMLITDIHKHYAEFKISETNQEEDTGPTRQEPIKQTWDFLRFAVNNKTHQAIKELSEAMKQARKQKDLDRNTLIRSKWKDVFVRLHEYHCGKLDLLKVLYRWWIAQCTLDHVARREEKCKGIVQKDSLDEMRKQKALSDQASVQNQYGHIIEADYKERFAQADINTLLKTRAEHTLQMLDMSSHEMPASVKRFRSEWVTNLDEGTQKAILLENLGKLLDVKPVSLIINKKGVDLPYLMAHFGNAYTTLSTIPDGLLPFETTSNSSFCFSHPHC